jgi:hypothetical protein
MNQHIIAALIALNKANAALIDALGTWQHEPEARALLDKIEKGETRIIGALKAMNQ